MPRKPGYTSYSAALDGSEMTRDEWEFLLAVAAFQRRTGRRYPTWREILHVLRCLGYRKVDDPVPVCEPHPPEPDDPSPTPPSQGEGLQSPLPSSPAREKLC